MSKNLPTFACSNCDAQYLKWQGRCSECGQWGTVLEISLTTSNGNNELSATIIDGKQIDENQTVMRWPSGNIEIDRVLGGGLVPGCLLLLGGEPGVGKSTLVAQLADAWATDKQVIYASGEESAAQIGLRLRRLNCQPEKLRFIANTNLSAILKSLEQQVPDILIIDFIQTMRVTEENGEAGGLNQIRAATVRLLTFAKQKNCAVLIIGHITKDGQLAGPKTLEHLVDAVLYLETDASQTYRLLRSSKNRFGSTDEVGIFEMSSTGLLPIHNPSGLFLGDERLSRSGSIISAVSEGARAILTEVQALTAKTVFGYPQRRSAGFDLNRLQVLTAVLGKRGKLNLSSHDIIINIAGGFKFNDPGLDLPVCLSITSSLKDTAYPADCLVIGEVGLAGEIRPVPRLEAKLNAAAQLGFTSAITPPFKNTIKNLKITQVSHLEEALKLY